MRRKILFRGYNLKNQKWLYGYYLVNRGQHFICPEGVDISNLLASSEDFVVEEESVGQRTGANDVENRDIYEGDILRMNRCHDDLGYVRYRNDNSAFTIQEKEKLGWWYLFDKHDEVIGNIYENRRMITLKNWNF